MRAAKGGQQERDLNIYKFNCILLMTNCKLNQLFDILGKMLDEYLILSITFSNHTMFLVGLKFMWSGNNYKNNKF